MSSNVKIQTADVLEIFDIKIRASDAHAQLDVAAGDSYDLVLANIAARSPTAAEKAGLDAAQSPSGSNPFITLDELNNNLRSRIPWKTIGLPGSGADYEGSDQTPFISALAEVPTVQWFHVKEGTYTFTQNLTIPSNVRFEGVAATSTVITGSLPVPLLTLSNESQLSYLTVSQTAAGSTAVEVLDTCEVSNCVLITPDTAGATLSVSSGVNDLRVFYTGLFNGQVLASGLTDATFHGLYVDAPGGVPLNLSSPVDVTLTGSIFKNGQPRVTSGTNVRVIGNHLNDGFDNVTPISSVLLRANTPNTNNNDADDFTNLLQYVGSPSLLTSTPAYSSNFAGPQGQDLTSRASAIDLLIQWRYEERNFFLIAPTEPTTITWDSSTSSLTSTGPLTLRSAHRSESWVLPTLASTLNSGYVLYYLLDRSLDNLDITLTPQILPIGVLPNTTYNQQAWALAFNLNGTLWWRGGNGSRFPAGAQGTYFVDGTSKGLLDYLGSPSYNTSTPSYSNNFAGLQGESLTARAGKQDLLLKRLYEYSNLGVSLLDQGFISLEGNTLTLSSTLYLSLPHVAGRITVPAQTWTIADNQIVYFTWDQSTLAGSDQAVSSTTVASVGSLPLPDNYSSALKYFVFARRFNGMVYLWDGTELPSTGGRWPVPIGRSVIRTSAPSTLSDNIVWDGTNLLWEKLAVVTATGTSLSRNAFVDKTSADPSLTSLSDGQGLVVTHTWNPGGAQNVSVARYSLPLSFVLGQNQFVWVQNLGGSLVFSD